MWLVYRSHSTYWILLLLTLKVDFVDNASFTSKSWIQDFYIVVLYHCCYLSPIIFLTSTLLYLHSLPPAHFLLLSFFFYLISVFCSFLSLHLLSLTFTPQTPSLAPLLPLLRCSPPTFISFSSVRGNLVFEQHRVNPSGTHFTSAHERGCSLCLWIMEAL